MNGHQPASRAQGGPRRQNGGSGHIFRAANEQHMSAVPLMGEFRTGQRQAGRSRRVGIEIERLGPIHILLAQADRQHDDLAGRLAPLRKQQGQFRKLQRQRRRRRTVVRPAFPNSENIPDGKSIDTTRQPLELIRRTAPSRGSVNSPRTPVPSSASTITVPSGSDASAIGRTGRPRGRRSRLNRHSSESSSGRTRDIPRRKSLPGAASGLRPVRPLRYCPCLRKKPAGTPAGHARSPTARYSPKHAPSERCCRSARGRSYSDRPHESDYPLKSS